jgi:hypothetical protein
MPQWRSASYACILDLLTEDLSTSLEFERRAFSGALSVITEFIPHVQLVGLMSDGTLHDNTFFTTLFMHKSWI